MKVLIVEDHELARNGLVYALKELSEFEIAGEASNGENAITMIGERRPDVVLMDIGLPVMDGIEVTQRIKEQFPEIKVVMLTSRQEQNEILGALAAGADAYCMKDISTDRLIQVIEMVSDGAFWLDPSVAKSVMGIVRPKLPQTGKAELFQATRQPQRYRMELTEREMEVLAQLVEGKNNKEIAELLEITVNTVKAHVASIIQKMAVDDRTQAALKALREGLVNPR